MLLIRCRMLDRNEEVRRKFRVLRNPEKARLLQRFFKTGPGQYGEGDVFHGIMVPDVRKLVAQQKGLRDDEAVEFLRSPFHEERLFALLCLANLFRKGSPETRKRIYETYLGHTRWVNNWDLVDLSAPHIVGAFLADRPRQVLYDLARSPLIWERRIAIISTLHFIRAGDLDDTFRIARALLGDREDLIHKASGWMLREAGKRDLAALERFLEDHAVTMPRTMLRYAIEKFPDERRKYWLKAKEERLSKTGFSRRNP